MVLESTMICLDSSDYQRNGDYAPTRLHVQKDGINLICRAKMRSNPENNVGLMTIASSVEVLATLTPDAGRIYTKMHDVQPKGELQLVTGLRIAHLVLKHRQGRNHKMRIVVFVGSPIGDPEPDIVKLAKRLKKEKVCVDVVSFGGHDQNDPLLDAFVAALNGKDNGAAGSHLLNVPRGTMIADVLLQSPIVRGEDGTGGAGMAAAGFEFGVDPDEDPELALALRISMEEQRALQEQAARRQLAAATPASDEPAVSVGAPPPSPRSSDVDVRASVSSVGTATTDHDENSEEAMLQRAIAMSLQTYDNNPDSEMPDFTVMSEEEQIAYAVQMSMSDDDDVMMAPTTSSSATSATSSSSSRAQPTPPPSHATPFEAGEMDVDEAYEIDPESLRSVLEHLPGVDPMSAEVRDVLGALDEDEQAQNKKAKKEDDDDGDEEEKKK